MADARAAVSALSARLLLTPTESFSVLNGQDMMLSLRHTFLREVEQMPCTEHTRSDMRGEAPASVRSRRRKEEHSGAGAQTFKTACSLIKMGQGELRTSCREASLSDMFWYWRRVSALMKSGRSALRLASPVFLLANTRTAGQALSVSVEGAEARPRTSVMSTLHEGPLLTKRGIASSPRTWARQSLVGAIPITIPVRFLQSKGNLSKDFPCTEFLEILVRQLPVCSKCSKHDSLSAII